MVRWKRLETTSWVSGPEKHKDIALNPFQILLKPAQNLPKPALKPGEYILCMYIYTHIYIYTVYIYI